MGRKSREKGVRPAAPQRSDRPRWAGAPGFDRSYFIADLYASTRDRLRAAQESHNRYEEARTQIDLARFQLDVLYRQVGTLETALARRGVARDDPRTDSVGVPGDYPGKPADFRRYAETLGWLADDHLKHLRQATPIVFDPLSVPGVSLDAVDGLGLPFPVVVADFLAPGGMSLPVQAFDGDSDWWVGLVAATVAQGEEGGPVDVWPTVMTLDSERADRDQKPTELMFGHVRFGGPLPSPPDGITLVEFDGGAAWILEDIYDGERWAALWVIRPALAAISALRVLDAVNVDLTEVALPRAARRRAAREAATPALTVDITTGARVSSEPADGSHVEWKHRWMVRGHWKHYGEQTAIARRHPSRVKDIPGHGRCVRVWCPPFVKGPADKPLVLKTRVVSNPTPVSGRVADHEHTQETG